MRKIAASPLPGLLHAAAPRGSSGNGAMHRAARTFQQEAGITVD